MRHLHSVRIINNDIIIIIIIIIIVINLYLSQKLL